MILIIRMNPEPSCCTSGGLQGTKGLRDSSTTIKACQLWGDGTFSPSKWPEKSHVFHSLSHQNHPKSPVFLNAFLGLHHLILSLKCENMWKQSRIMMLTYQMYPNVTMVAAWFDMLIDMFTHSHTLVAFQREPFNPFISISYHFMMRRGGQGCPVASVEHTLGQTSLASVWNINSLAVPSANICSGFGFLTLVHPVVLPPVPFAPVMLPWRVAPAPVVPVAVLPSGQGRNVSQTPRGRHGHRCPFGKKKG